MNRKSVHLIVNDLFVELKEENNRLYEQLLFAEKVIKVLEKFRNYLNNSRINCEFNEFIGNQLIFDDLENEYQMVLNNENQIQSDLNEELVAKSDEILCPEIEINSREVLNKTLNNNKFNKGVKKSLKSLKDSRLKENNNNNNNNNINCIQINTNENNNITTDPKSSKNVTKNVKKVLNKISAKEDFLKVQNLSEDQFILGDFNANVKKMNKLFGFRCNYSDCDFGDQSLNVVKEHLNRLHLNQKPYVCITCGLSFFGEPSLRSHHRIHAKKRFKCDFVDCNYETNIQKQLNEHLMRHKKIKPFDCLWPGCESKFCTEKELRLHGRHRHSDERPFVCEWPLCDSRFKNKYGLIIHFRTHTGEKPFTCEWPACHKTFTDHTQFKRHKMAHNDIRNHVCDRPQCGKRFITLNRLKNHLMVHDGIKPFKCEWNGCDKRFREKAKMKRHLNVHRKKVEKVSNKLK